MFENIFSIVSAASRAAAPVIDETCIPKAIRVHADDLLSVCTALYTNESTYFDMLSCITGIDNGPDKGTIEIAYNLYSIPFHLHLMLKVTVPRDGGAVESISSIWKTANWHERELYDMYGVVVKNHPDLRRILLPSDWQGHPLLKDYKVEEYYKGIKTDY